MILHHHLFSTRSSKGGTNLRVVTERWYCIIIISWKVLKKTKNQQTRELIRHPTNTTKTWVTYASSHMACQHIACKVYESHHLPKVHSHETQETATERIPSTYVLDCFASPAFTQLILWWPASHPFFYRHPYRQPLSLPFFFFCS